MALYCSAGGSAGQKARNAKSVPFQSSSFFPQFISGKKSSLKTAQKIFIARRDDWKSRRQLKESWPIKHTNIFYPHWIPKISKYIRRIILIVNFSRNAFNHCLERRDCCSVNEDSRSVDVTNPRATAIKIWLYHQRLYLEPRVILPPLMLALLTFQIGPFQVYESSPSLIAFSFKKHLHLKNCLQCSEAP